ncbi:PREDICTED: zinc finger protein 98-like [Cyphomyrmex costatus]|uniref:zinc finger protein 98-like n=1 Tax=Cyphomyrmex costatus TaxID=456900 RepID=UPI0008522E1C|nr:PREDICTED: zinc finger protein 98-like [Cyphomyrmex costatus]
MGTHAVQKHPKGRKDTLRSHVIAIHANDERFKSNKDLYTGGVSYKCGTCNKEFKNQRDLRIHERIHNDEKPYQCEFCENKFRQKCHLKSHMVAKHFNDERFKANKDLYTGGVSYKCAICNKEFKNKTHLHLHEMTHTGEKPYQCEFCKDKFRRKDYLRSHVMAKHFNDERFKANKDLYTRSVSYKCAICNKEFKNKSHLHLHDMTHTGEKPYQCEFCKDKFRMCSSLALSLPNLHELKPLSRPCSVNPFTGCCTQARNDTQAQYCKTPVDNARSDIDRSSSGGTWRNDCSAEAGMKISEADAHNDTIETKVRRRKRKSERFTGVHTLVPAIPTKRDRKGIEK